MEPVSHEEVIPLLAEHLRPIFAASPDGVYVWLDEEHWTCNERLASMFGYSVKGLENGPHFLQRLVAEDDQEIVSWNYWNRVQELAFPVTFRFRGVAKDGTLFQAETDMIPFTYGGSHHRVPLLRRVGD